MAFFSLSNRTSSITRLSSAPNEFNLYEAVLFGVITTCLSVFTVVSNAVIIHLTRTSNELKPLGPLRALIGSMAWSDLLMGMVVMPLEIQYSLLEEWRLGDFGCQFYICCEVLGGAATSLHLSTIAIDRYLAIMHPVTYKNLDRSYIKWAISVTWFTSFMIVAPIVIFDGHAYRILEGQYHCDAPESGEMTILINFFVIGIPYSTIWIIYIVLYCTSKRMLEERMSKTMKVYQHITQSRSKSDSKGEQDYDEVEDDDEERRVGCFTCVSAKTPFRSKSTKACLGCQAIISVSALKSGLCKVCRSPNDLLTAAMESRIKVLTKMNRKTLFVTLVITCTFTLCYCPIGTQYQVSAFCPQCQTSPRLSTTFLWLAYTMSALNPIIYGLFNVNFRRAFKKLVSC